MRKREFQELLRVLDKVPADRAMILCGDFNFLGPDKRRIALTNKYDYFSGSFFDKTWKHHPNLSPIAANLDYIFWNPDTTQVQPRLLQRNTSDHRGIVASIITQQVH